MAAEYEIELEAFIGQGKPKFYVKMCDGDSKLPPRNNNYHFESKQDHNNK